MPRHSHKLRPCDAAKLASLWYEGMWSHLYRFQCMVRKNAMMDRLTLEGSLLEISDCLHDLIHNNPRPYSQAVLDEMRELCRLRGYIRNQIDFISQVEDLVEEADDLAYDIMRG